jgi:hypothetical protein
MIRVTIEIDHYDGEIKVVRDDSLGWDSTQPASERLAVLMRCAEASARAALKASPE